MGRAEWVDVTVHWAGGFSSDHELVRPVQRYQQMADYEKLLNRIDELREAGQTLAEVAEHLNREGFHPQVLSHFSRGNTLAGLLAKRGLRQSPSRVSWSEAGVLG